MDSSQDGGTVRLSGDEFEMKDDVKCMAKDEKFAGYDLEDDMKSVVHKSVNRHEDCMIKCKNDVRCTGANYYSNSDCKIIYAMTYV